MKNLIYFAFILLPISLLAQTNYLVEYEYRSTIDSLNPAQKETEVMSLFLLEEKSYYLSKNNYIWDSIFDYREKTNYQSPRVNGVVRTADITAGISKTAFRQKLLLDDEKYKVQGRVGLQRFLFEENQQDLNWNFTTETDDFKGYTIKKATLRAFGRDWTAWYTEEIPIAEGPYKFKGLPGLVLKLVDGQSFFNFDMISFQKIEYEPVIRFSLVKDTTREEYVKFVQKYIEDPLILLQFAPVSIQDEQGFAQRKRESLKRNNNHLDKTLWLDVR